MTEIIHLLKDTFKKATLAAFPALEDFPLDLTESTQEKFGHYQYNSSMKLAKMVGMPPRAIAEKIVLHVVKDSLIDKLEIAGPGFINIFLTLPFLSKQVEKIVAMPHLGIPLPKKSKVIVEFSSPNVAKELHVGHLRSTIIGDAIARLFEFLGYEVIRLNHVGDWGTQFGMLIAHMKEKHQDVIQGQVSTDLPHLMQWYKDSKTRFDADPDFKKRSQLEVVSLQGGEKEARQVWELICEISRKGYQEIYDLLDVHLNERGESFYNLRLPEVVKELEQKGLVTVSDGAKCIFLEGFKNREGEPLPLMVQKSDGGYNYDTTDMAAIQHRIDDEKADRIIYVTDSGQSLHFQMVFKAAEKAGWLKPEQPRVDHVGFGLVLGPDGKKFKTRSGDTEKLIDLLLKACEEADKILQTRSPDMLPDERKHLAQALGLSAVKYADLSSNRVSDYSFSYDKMLRFEGNTAAFLMYSYVRILGIKRKVGPEAEKLIQNAHISLKHQSEVQLGLHLARFEDTLDAFANELMPHRLTEYLYNLAEKFNAFFRDCRVEGSPEMPERLRLCEACLKVLETGFQILGIQRIEKM